jgi:hypothetical protein
MRDNGLTAASYTSLGGIDPLVAEPVLDALAAAGIAAYCENQSEARTPEEAEEAPVRIPVGYDEIFVDAEAVDRARPVIDRSTEDAEWQSLVEQFSKPSAPGHDGGEDPVPRWPVSEDVDEKYEPLIDVPTGLTVEEKTEEDAEPPAKKADDPHDHYVPPEPPRGPRPAAGLDQPARLARAARRAAVADRGRAARLRHRPDHHARGRRVHRRIPHPGVPDEGPASTW